MSDNPIEKLLYHDQKLSEIYALDNNEIETEFHEDFSEAERCRISENTWYSSLKADLDRVAEYDPRQPGTKFPEEDKRFIELAISILER